MAGVSVSIGDSKYTLVECGSCGGAFKDPAVDGSILKSAYRQADGSQWGASTEDLRFRNLHPIARALKRHSRSSDRRVLDVGCGSGAVVESLFDGWAKFGIEPSVRAAALAEARGVSIVAPDLDSWGVVAVRYPVVMALDVLEHVAEPEEFFQKLALVTCKGGLLVIVTGNPGAPSWRLEKGRYWYCSLIEHITFPSPESLITLAGRCGFVSLDVTRIRHKNSKLTQRFLETSKNLAYVLACIIARFWLPNPLTRVVNRCAPVWISAKDHQLHVFRRVS